MNYSSYVNTTLHTNFNYFRPNVIFKGLKEGLGNIGDVSGKIDILERKEKSFY